MVTVPRIKCGWISRCNYLFRFNPINIDDDANFIKFPPEDDVNLSSSEAQGEHHPHVQTIQGDKHSPIINNGSSVAQELPRLHVWTKDYPPNQVIGNPNACVQTRSAQFLKMNVISRHLSQWLNPNPSKKHSNMLTGL